MAVFDPGKEIMNAEGLVIAYSRPQGPSVIQKWLKNSNAPLAHRFATSTPGSKRKHLKSLVDQAGAKTEDVLDKPHWGCTPMDLAIASDNPKALEELVKMGANPNNKSGLKFELPQYRGQIFDAHPIHAAIHFRRDKCLEVLLDANSSVKDTYPERPNDVIHHALFKLDTVDRDSKNIPKSENVIKVLLSSREGKEAVDVFVTHTANKVTTSCPPLQLNIYHCTVEDAKNDLEYYNVIVRVAKMLLDAGANPNKTYNQTPPLQMVCDSDVKSEVTSMLIQYGANPNQYSGLTGETCLYSALKNSRHETVEVLLKLNVDVNAMGPNGKRPFDGICVAKKQFSISKFFPDHAEFRIKMDKLPKDLTIFSKMDLLSPEEICYKYPYNGIKEDIYERPSRIDPPKTELGDIVSQGDIDRLKDRLGKCSITEINAQDRNGCTALHNAVIKNDIEMVELLLENGSDVNIEDYAKNTPLNHAAKRLNSLEIIEMLLSNGADVDHRGTEGKTALYHAVEYNNVENFEYLCITKSAKVDIEERTDNTTPLHLVAQENNIHILEIILKVSNSDVNVRTGFSATPLHYAARTNAKEATTLLINKGASVTTKCLFLENTPLHVAAACNSNEVAHVLIENGATINEKNKCQETPLFLAAATGSNSMVTYLLDQGAEIDSMNIHGQTPLYIAISYEEFETARLLIERGADIEARDKHRNETILHIATSAGNIEFIKYLLGKGAKKEAKDFHGLTPLLRSAAIKTPGLTLTLLQHGCNAGVTLPGTPEVNLINLIKHNKNSVAFKDMVSMCPKTKKPKLHPSLKSLPKETQEKTLRTWKCTYLRKSK